MLVFLCGMGCARGQNVDADTVTSETESAMLESLTDKGETGGQTADYDASSLLVSEQGAVISQNTSPKQEKQDEPKNSQTAEQSVKSTAASSSSGAADSSKTSASAAKTSAAPTKAASTSSTDSSFTHHTHNYKGGRHHNHNDKGGSHDDTSAGRLDYCC